MICNSSNLPILNRSSFCSSVSTLIGVSSSISSSSKLNLLKLIPLARDDLSPPCLPSVLARLLRTGLRTGSLQLRILWSKVSSKRSMIRKKPWGPLAKPAALEWVIPRSFMMWGWFKAARNSASRAISLHVYQTKHRYVSQNVREIQNQKTVKNWREWCNFLKSSYHAASTYLSSPLSKYSFLICFKAYLQFSVCLYRSHFFILSLLSISSEVYFSLSPWRARSKDLISNTWLNSPDPRSGPSVISSRWKGARTIASWFEFSPISSRRDGGRVSQNSAFFSWAAAMACSWGDNTLLFLKLLPSLLEEWVDASLDVWTEADASVSTDPVRSLIRRVNFLSRLLVEIIFVGLPVITVNTIVQVQLSAFMVCSAKRLLKCECWLHSNK